MMTEPVTVDLRGLEISGQFGFFCFHTTSWRSLQRLQNIVLQHVRTIQGSIIYSELDFFGTSILTLEHPSLRWIFLEHPS